MKRTSALLTNNLTYTSPQRLTPGGIVVHSTGVNQKRIAAYRWQFDRPTQYASVHGIIGLDEDGVLTYEQWLPYNYQCWGVGTGRKGSLNKTHLQFEICEHLGDRDWCLTTYAAALDICEEWCRTFNISPDKVVCHSEAHAMGYGSNHGDVMHWWPKYGLSMDGFRAELAERLRSEPKNEPTTEGGATVTIDLPVLRKGAHNESVRALQQLLTAQGYDTQGADGIFGNNTDAAVRKFQKANGLDVDGIAGRDTWTALLT